MTGQSMGLWMVGALLGGLVTAAQAQPASGEAGASNAPGMQPNAPVPSTPAPSTTVPSTPAPAPRAIPRRDDDTPPPRGAAPTMPVAAAGSPMVTPAPSAAPSIWANRPVSVLLRAGFEIGGDDLITISTTNGDSSTITAGTGGVLEAGVLITPPQIPLAVELTVGYKANRASFSNGDSSFTRVPLNAIVSATSHGHRFGIGVTAQLAPSFECNITGVCSGSVDLDTAFGMIFQWAYTYHHTDFGARATLISYKVDGPMTVSADGTSFGAFIGVRL